jgi:VNT family MFS transporter (synaptic vesicle glycoprotein 2)
MFYCKSPNIVPLSLGLAWLIIPQDWTVELSWLPVIFSSWRVFVVLNAIPSIVTTAILFILPESPKFLFSRGKEQEALDVLRHVFAVNTGRDTQEYPVRFLQSNGRGQTVFRGEGK